MPVLSISQPIITENVKKSESELIYNVNITPKDIIKELEGVTINPKVANEYAEKLGKELKIDIVRMKLKLKERIGKVNVLWNYSKKLYYKFECYDFNGCNKFLEHVVQCQWSTCSPDDVRYSCELCRKYSSGITLSSGKKIPCERILKWKEYILTLPTEYQNYIFSSDNFACFLTNAKKFLLNSIVDINLGKWFGIARQKPIHEMSVADYAELYIKVLKKGQDDFETSVESQLINDFFNLVQTYINYIKYVINNKINLLKSKLGFIKSRKDTNINKLKIILKNINEIEKNFIGKKDINNLNSRIFELRRIINQIEGNYLGGYDIQIPISYILILIICIIICLYLFPKTFQYNDLFYRNMCLHANSF